uniref:Nuclear protein MDM1 n=1 Tax=Cavia porcellus TaxID=10141 RepID=A0A286XFU2_CAVPO
MPVRFKGLSEYQRNFLWKKSYLSESCNSSVERKYPWAGLRSDQLGITKEPGFISKRRVPYHDPQISKSLKWNGALSENDVVVSPEPEVPETPKSEAEQEDVNQEKVLSLEASTFPKRGRSHSADSRAEGTPDAVEKHEDVATNHILVNENVDQEHSTNLLPEHVDNGVGTIRTVVLISKPELHGETLPQKKKKNLKHIKGEFKMCNKMDDPLKLEAEMAPKDSNEPKKKLTPWRHQKLGNVNSEYKAKFLSPAQYLYKGGSWTRVKENMPNQVKELREKAEFYRKRVQGTHFSRDHLNQILSDKNYCWDVSSTTSSEGSISSNIKALDLARDPTSHKTLQKCLPTKPEEKREILEEQPQKSTMEKLDVSEPPTLPVRRQLAWGAENTDEDTRKQPREEKEEEEERGSDKPVHVEELEKLDIHKKSQADNAEGSDSSVSSGKGGRLPTPKLRELGGIQRTHHDLTTPAIGGAVLVSPSKIKPPISEQRRKMSSQGGIGTPKNDFTKKGSRAVSLLTSPAAGIKTVDPLPLREDSDGSIPRCAETTLPVSTALDYPTNSQGQLPSLPCTPSFWHPARRIQGSLRDPEFQHNGMGKAKMKNFQLPQHEAFNNEDEDRLSEISARSAASSLRAFQTLTRAQKRKENFWGKT